MKSLRTFTMTELCHTSGEPRSVSHAGILLAVLCFLAVASEARADQVTRKSDGATLRGEFTDMTVESVSIKLSNGKLESVPVSDIRNVRFDAEPALMSQAQVNERSGALDVALEKYQQVQSELGGGDKRVSAEVQFLIARTLVKLSEADPAKQPEALKSIQEFRTGFPTNFRFLEACLLEAESSSRAGDTANAQTLLQQVQASSVKGFQLQAGVQLGRLLLSSGDVNGASIAFDQVVQQSTGDTSATTAMFDGMLGKAMCQLQQGEVDQAISALDDVIFKAGDADTRVLAEAWNKKGDCLRQKNSPKGAMMAYLHVDVLYASEPAEHAQALYRLSQLWGPAGHADRADDAAGRLLEKYPNSTWAKQMRAGN
ncbi:MAG: tetratricopeptide repeat protein [Planctomycetaceae bacterium]